MSDPVRTPAEIVDRLSDIIDDARPVDGAIPVECPYLSDIEAAIRCIERLWLDTLELRTRITDQRAINEVLTRRLSSLTAPVPASPECTLWGPPARAEVHRDEMQVGTRRDR